MMPARKDSKTRKGEVLRVALQVVAEEGIHALTLHELSRRIGISEAALFRHFENKQDIVNSLAEWVFKEYIVNESEGENDIRRAMANLMRRQFLEFQKCPEATSILFQEEVFREFPQAKGMFDERRKSRAAQIMSMIRKAKANGEIGSEVDEATFSLIFIGTMRMAVMEWRSSGFAYDLTTREEAITRELVKLLPAPESARDMQRS